MMNSGLLRVGEVASRAALSVDTIRYYERKGLLPRAHRDASGHRRFPPEVIGRLRVIRRATAVGFTLDELISIFRRRAAGQQPCGHALQVAKRKLVELDERIAELDRLRVSLADVITSWEEKLDATPPGGLAYLLESLTGNGDTTS